jgi:hypothetical protein
MFADLAAIAYSKKMPRTLLSLVVRSLLLSSHRFVAPAPRVVLTEIADELGVETEDPWIENERVSKRFPAFYEELMKRSSEDVRRAAAAAFERLSPHALPELAWK